MCADCVFLMGLCHFKRCVVEGNLLSAVTVSNSIRCGLNHAALCINTHAKTVADCV